MIKVWSSADILNMYAEDKTMGWRSYQPDGATSSIPSAGGVQRQTQPPSESAPINDPTPPSTVENGSAEPKPLTEPPES